MTTKKELQALGRAMGLPQSALDNLKPWFPRTAQCTCCKRTNPSDEPLPGYICLPFFRARPEWAMDEFYCGCRGWD